MRGTAWVNAFQTVLFLFFGAIAFLVIGHGMGGFRAAVERCWRRRTRRRCSRGNESRRLFLQLHVYPALGDRVSAHQHLLPDGEKMGQFKRTVILYPICILAIWLPCVFLGSPRTRWRVPRHRAEAGGAERSCQRARIYPADERTELRRQAAGDDVLLLLLDRTRRTGWRGMLGAGIMAAVMASDSQILALSTMFTEDVFAYYGGKSASGSGAGADRQGVRGCGHPRRVRRRVESSAGDLRPGFSVRFLGLRGALAAGCGGPVLARKHEVGRLARRSGRPRRSSTRPRPRARVFGVVASCRSCLSR